MSFKTGLGLVIASLAISLGITTTTAVHSSAAGLANTTIQSVTGKKTKKAKTKRLPKTWSAHLALQTGISANTKFKANQSQNAVMSKQAFKSAGRIHWHKRVFTYYSPNGSHALGMGSYTSDGTYTLRGYDSHGYLILANNKPFGTKVKTPLGWGVVHDRGTTGNHYDIVIK